MVNPKTDQELVLNYIVSQAERFDFSALWTRNIKARIDVLDSLRDVTEFQASFKPSDQEWSISEVVSDLLNGSTRVAAIVISLAFGKSGAPSEVDPSYKPATSPITQLKMELWRDGNQLF